MSFLYAPAVSPTLAQQELLDDPDSRIFWEASCGAGKTEYLLMEALRAIESPGTKVAFVFRYTADFEAGDWGLKDRLKKLLEGSETKYHFNANLREFRFDNGSWIHFLRIRSCEDATFKLGGYDCQVMLIDNCDQHEEKTRKYLFSRVRNRSDKPEQARCRFVEVRTEKSE